MVASVHVPEFLLKPSGVWYQDIVPCASLVFCIPTLKIYYDKKNYLNLALFSLGFVFALIYHAVHMNVEGLDNAVFLGVTGTTWRTVDIIMCQVLLARTFGNAIGDRHPIVAAIPTVAFPATLAYLFFSLESVKLTIVSQLTGLSMLVTAVIKLIVDGRKFPGYSAQSAARMLVCFFLGFFCFSQPERQPHLYWFWHSMWHVFMGLGYYELYSQLVSQQKKKLQ